MIKNNAYRELGHGLLILLVGTIAYSNSFQVPFVLDDLHAIVRNTLLHDPLNYLPGGIGYETMPRRWVGYFTFALNHHFGGLNPWGYHLVNLAIHLANALLLYLLLILTFRTPQLRGSTLAPAAAKVALVAALIFVAHPLQTQAVTYLVQRLASLATFFYLLSLVAYIAARLRSDKNHPPAMQPPKRSGLQPVPNFWPVAALLATAAISALLAMQTKEIAFTLPLTVALYELSFFHGPWRPRLLYLSPLLLTLPLIPLLTLFANPEPGSGLSADPADTGENLRASSDLPRHHYLFTQIRVLVTYLRLLLLPIGQNIDYDYPIFTTFFAPPVLLSSLLLATLLGLGLYLYRHSGGPSAAPGRYDHDPAWRLLSFAVFWFFLTLSVESSLIPIHDLIFEHRLYLALPGPAISAALFFAWATRKVNPGNPLPLVVGVLILLTLTAATWQRNQIWRDNITLWQDSARYSPNKVRPWYNLGSHLSEAGRFEEALPPLRRALELDPKHGEAWHNLGRSLIMLNRNQEAIAALRNAVALEPMMANAIANLGVALIRAGQPAEAAELLADNLELFPNWPEVRLNLGLAYLEIGNLPAARQQLPLLRRLHPQMAATLERLLMESEQ